MNEKTIEVKIADLDHKVQLAMVGSCSCITASPDPSRHRENCRFRMLGEVRAGLMNLAALTKKSQKQVELALTATPSAPEEAGVSLVCPKCKADLFKEYCKEPGPDCAMMSRPSGEKTFFATEQEAIDYRDEHQLHGRVPEWIAGRKKWVLNFPLDGQVEVRDGAPECVRPYVDPNFSTTLEVGEEPKQKLCPGCNCKLADRFGGLENHAADCDYFPL